MLNSTPRFGRSLGLVLSIGLLGVLAVGCGSEPGSRRPVSGEVAIDKQSLESGSITFLPEGEGSAATGEIVDGKFRIGADEGPSPGAYKIVILSSRSTGKRVPSRDDPSVLIDEVVNIVPTRYNVQTTLRAEVKREGVNQFPFSLDSHPETARAKPRGRTRKG